MCRQRIGVIESIFRLGVDRLMRALFTDLIGVVVEHFRRCHDQMRENFLSVLRENHLPDLWDRSRRNLWLERTVAVTGQTEM